MLEVRVLDVKRLLPCTRRGSDKPRAGAQASGLDVVAPGCCCSCCLWPCAKNSQQCCERSLDVASAVGCRNRGSGASGRDYPIEHDRRQCFWRRPGWFCSPVTARSTASGSGDLRPVLSTCEAVPAPEHAKPIAHVLPRHRGRERAHGACPPRKQMVTGLGTRLCSGLSAPVAVGVESTINSTFMSITATRCGSARTNWLVDREMRSPIEQAIFRHSTSSRRTARWCALDEPLDRPSHNGTKSGVCACLKSLHHLVAIWSFSGRILGKGAAAGGPSAPAAARASF
jgi:hypothetical protein